MKKLFAAVALLSAVGVLSACRFHDDVDEDRRERGHRWHHDDDRKEHHHWR